LKTQIKLNEIEQRITNDKKLLFTITSYAVVLLMLLNQNTLQSPVLGLPASTIYFLINGIFLGNALFKKETAFFRLTLGILLLLLLLGFTGWLAVITHILDLTRFTLVLITVATISSLLNKRMKSKT
jgi:hypothetical protein